MELADGTSVSAVTWDIMEPVDAIWENPAALINLLESLELEFEVPGGLCVVS